MKAYSIITATLLLIHTCSASLWGTDKVDPIAAEQALPPVPVSKYDYKRSFKKPFIYNETIPFWSAGGDILRSNDFIRLSPSVPKSKGWVWSTLPNDYDEWEVEMDFKVSGNHINGGRGLAFWYAKEPMVTGPIYGSKDKWTGLGIWLDSMNPKTHEPSIISIVNDGKLSFTKKGGADPFKVNIGVCSTGFRNAPAYSSLKVVYKDNVLLVLMSSGANGAKEYRICSQKKDVTLPKGYYFGVSAASSSPADDHDIISFETRQLNPPQKLVHPKRPLEEEKRNSGKEFSGIDEEQKKRIEEAEEYMRQLREESSEQEKQGETALTLAYIYDAQRRALESINVLQWQVEAMGAPSAADIITGNYDKNEVSKKNGAERQAIVQELNNIAENLRVESQKATLKLERITAEQENKMKEIQVTATRLEDMLKLLDKRMSTQSITMQKKMSEVYAHSAETKGTMSTLLKYIFYALVTQFLLGIAG
ncbi:hypothetical protein K501DRAFT_213266, partial [Backusella circina FSU 941]